MGRIFSLPGKYDLKWKFYDRDSLGKETEVACFLFTIKII